MREQASPSWPGWETVRLIGRGSFGAVYEIQRDVFGDVEKAALKVISIPQNPGDIDEMYSEGYDEESITTAFQSHLKSIVGEYSLMRKMNGSANVVNCDDLRYVRHENGIGWDIFIKMELLTPLTKALPAAIPEATVIRLGRDLCAALELCKKHGIIHRDIKPKNIFLSDNGDYKLGDFGIAKTVEKTMGGTKTGTYKYMAPEVYNNQPYGSAADIYSLGLVLYWMLNERRMPFQPLPPEKLTVQMDEHSRNRRLCGEPLPEPKNGSDKLKAIVLKACAYDPKERYASAAAMRADLEALEDCRVFPAVHILPDFSNPAEYKAEEKTVGLFGRQNTFEVSDEGTDEATVGLMASEKTNRPEVPVGAVPATEPAEEECAPVECTEEPKPKKKKLRMAIGAVAAVLVTLLVIFFAGGGKDRDAVLQDRNDGTKETENIAQTEAVPETTAPNAESETLPVAPEELAPIIAVDAAWSHVVALRSDGTVSVVMETGNDQGQAETSEWTGITAVSAGRSHTVGLKFDGTVVAAGSDFYGQCDVSEWRDVVAIAAGDYFTAGLCTNGSVIVVGDNQWSQRDTDSLKDIVFIDASDDLLYCYDKNGVVTVLGKQYGRHELGKVPDCAVLSISLNRSVVLTTEGTARLVEYVSNEKKQYDISGWSNLVQIDAGLNHIVGLRADGRVEAVGTNEYGECDVTEWTDIVYICAAHGYTVGIRANGTVVATGKYTGTGDVCDVSGLNMHTKRIPEQEQYVFPEVTEPEEEKESVIAGAPWSDWLTELPDGVDSAEYEIQEKTQYSYYIISEQNWAEKGSWMCTECAITPGADRYVVDSVEETWESCWRDGNGNYVCDCLAHPDSSILLPNQPVGGATSYYEEKLSESATQYRYCDKINGSTYGEWSAWQFESVSASESRQVETRTVFRYGVKVTATTHYHCHPVWSAYGDTPVKEDSDTAVRTRTVYRYRERT